MDETKAWKRELDGLIEDEEEYGSRSSPDHNSLREQSA